MLQRLKINIQEGVFYVTYKTIVIDYDSKKKYGMLIKWINGEK